MIKNLLYSIACLLTVSHASGQITLTSSGYPASLIGSDSIRQTLVGTSFPNFHAATAGTWDMTLCSYGSSIFPTPRIASTTGAQFAENTVANFGPYSIPTTVEKSITSNGFVRFGYLSQATGFSLSGITGGAHDTLVIDSQYVAYNIPDTILKLPATYNTNWMTHFTYNYNFHITVAVASLNNTPGYIRSLETTIDTVIGWGQMRVVPLTGTTPRSGYMNVLQVKSLTYVTDSFYIGGFPAPATLLGAFNFTQGQSDTFWEQNYYRAAEITPLAYVSFAQNFDSATTAKTHAQRLAPSAVRNLVNDNLVKIYPNPVTNGSFTIELPVSAGVYSYEVMDMNGHIIQQNTLKGNEELVSLSSEIAGGIYFLRVYENGKVYCVRGLDIAK